MPKHIDYWTIFDALARVDLGEVITNEHGHVHPEIDHCISQLSSAINKVQMNRDLVASAGE